MKTTQTPMTLSESPSRTEFHLQAYDWNKQTRIQPMGGGADRITTGSVQTFDNKGKPTDANSDKD
jgi:hypothetical protein